MNTNLTNVKPSRLSPRSGVATAALGRGPARLCVPAGERARRRTPTLADAFAWEPELIRACLQGIGYRAPNAARRVFAAAQQALVRRPQYADLCYYASEAAVRAGDRDAAAALLERALGINPSYRDALILAARVARLRGQPELTRARLRAALQAGADYPDVHTLMGDVWREEGKWHRARAAYQRALELNANLPAVRAALALLPPTGTREKCDELPA